MTDFGEHVAFVEQETMHIPYKPQILFISRRLTDRLSPFFDRFQNAVLYPRRPHRGPLGEPPDQFIQELLRANLEMEGVAAILDTNVKQLYLSAPHCGSYPG